MTNKPMKRCPTFLLIKEIKISTTMVYHFPSTRLGQIYSLVMSSLGKDMGQQELPLTVGVEITATVLQNSKFCK